MNNKLFFILSMVSLFALSCQTEDLVKPENTSPKDFQVGNARVLQCPGQPDAIVSSLTKRDGICNGGFLDNRFTCLQNRIISLAPIAVTEFPLVHFEQFRIELNKKIPSV